MQAIAVTKCLDDRRRRLRGVGDFLRVEAQRARYRRQPHAAIRIDGTARLRAAVAAAHALAAAFTATRAEDHLRRRAQSRSGTRVGQRRYRKPPHAVDAGDIQVLADRAERPGVVARQTLVGRDHRQLALVEQAESGVERGDANHSIANRSDVADHASLERAGPCRSHHGIAAHAAQARLGADQQFSWRDKIDAAHARDVLARRRADPLELVVAIQVQPARRADPEVVGVLGDRVDLERVEFEQRRWSQQFAVTEDSDAAARADPQPAEGIIEQIVGRRVRQPLSRNQFLHAIGTTHGDIGIRAENHPSLRIAGDAPHEWIRQSVAPRHALDPAIPEAKQALGLAAEPQVAFAILIHRQDPGIAHEVVFGDAFQLSVRTQAEYGRRGREPLIAVVIAQQAFGREAVEVGIESAGSDARVVPAIQARRRAEPEVARLSRRAKMRDAGVVGLRW